MQAVIIDYGSGNLRSARQAFEYVAQGSSCHITVSDKAEIVAGADFVVLPGVGAFGDCRQGLAGSGLSEALQRAVIEKGRPFLGICVGMQLLASRGYEPEPMAGLNWIEGEVRPLAPCDKSYKVPHMGWNNLELCADHPVTADLGGKDLADHAYFVHSYAFYPKEMAHILMRCQYSEPIAAMIGRDNLVGTQFHPEKSQGFGLKLIENFLKWRP